MGCSRKSFARAATALFTLGLPCLQGLSAGNPSGQEIARDVYKGNCLACHRIPGDPSAVSLADIGPPLIHIRERFPDRSALRSQLWDPMVRNPKTVMPPFGKHKILTEEEIDLIVDYLYQY